MIDETCDQTGFIFIVHFLFASTPVDIYRGQISETFIQYPSNDGNEPPFSPLFPTSPPFSGPFAGLVRADQRLPGASGGWLRGSSAEMA